MPRTNPIRRSRRPMQAMVIAHPMGTPLSLRSPTAPGTARAFLAKLAVWMCGRPEPEAYERRRVAADNAARQITRSGWILF